MSKPLSVERQAEILNEQIAKTKLDELIKESNDIQSKMQEKYEDTIAEIKRIKTEANAPKNKRKLQSKRRMLQKRREQPNFMPVVDIWADRVQRHRRCVLCRHDIPAGQMSVRTMHKTKVKGNRDLINTEVAICKKCAQPLIQLVKDLDQPDVTPKRFQRERTKW